MKIFLPHPDISQEPSTSLTEPVSAGGSALTVINNAGLSANNYIIMGKIGEEKSELRQISSITGHLAMAVDTIDFDHPVDTPITYMPFNQIRIYMGDWSGRYATGTISISKSQDTALSSGKSTVTGSGTSWVVAGISTSHWLYVRDKWYQISSVTNATSLILTDTYEDEDIAGETYALVEFSYAATETIDVDSENTIYEDTDGLEEDYYISMYYNLQTSVAAAYSYPVGGTTKTGFLPDTLKVLRDSIYAEVDPNKEFLTDDLIDGWANDAGRDIRDEKAEWNFTKTETSITLVDNQAAYKLPDDLEVLGRVVYEKDDGTEHTYTQLRLVGEAEYFHKVENRDASASTNLTNAAIIGNNLYIYPTPDTTSMTVSKITLYYNRAIPVLEDDGDRIIIPNPTLVKWFCLAQGYMMLGKREKYLDILGMYNKGKRKLFRIDRKAHTRPKAFTWNPQNGRRYYE